MSTIPPRFRHGRVPAARRQMPRRALLISAAAALLGAWRWGECAAQADSQATEYKVKAAYLYKFASYVQWPTRTPDDADSALVIGLLGADLLGHELAPIVAERRVANRPVVVRKLRRDEPATGLHMLFIGRTENAHAAEILAAMRGRAVLTVTESETAFASGSMINFIILDDKIRFDVAPRQGELENLKISARLLAVAHRVVGDAP